VTKATRVCEGERNTAKGLGLEQLVQSFDRRINSRKKRLNGKRNQRETENKRKKSRRGERRQVLCRLFGNASAGVVQGWKIRFFALAHVHEEKEKRGGGKERETGNKLGRGGDDDR